jgi:hypothetical protein
MARNTKHGRRGGAASVSGIGKRVVDSGQPLRTCHSPRVLADIRDSARRDGPLSSCSPGFEGWSLEVSARRSVPASSFVANRSWRMSACVVRMTTGPRPSQLASRDDGDPPSGVSGGVELSEPIWESR